MFLSWARAIFGAHARKKTSDAAMDMPSSERVCGGKEDDFNDGMAPTSRLSVKELQVLVIKSLRRRVMEYPIPFPTFTAVLPEHVAELQQLRRDLAVGGVECARSIVQQLVGIVEEVFEYTRDRFVERLQAL